MGHCCSLSLVEQRKISENTKYEKSNNEIAKLLKRSHNAVNRFLKLKSVYGNKKYSGGGFKSETLTLA